MLHFHNAMHYFLHAQVQLKDKIPIVPSKQQQLQNATEIINTNLKVIFLPLWSKMEQTIKQWQEEKK